MADMEMPTEAMITTCRMPLSFRLKGTLSGGTFAQQGDPLCDQPLPVGDVERGSWMCDDCRAQSARRAAAVPPAVVPSVADVYQRMASDGVNQDEAVRRLGGTP